jgi:hypothetical protein
VPALIADADEKAPEHFLELVWLHHEAEAYLDAYIALASRDQPLLQSLNKTHRLPVRPSAGATCCVW